jgi:hypothetical protein
MGAKPSTLATFAHGQHFQLAFLANNFGLPSRLSGLGDCGCNRLVREQNSRDKTKLRLSHSLVQRGFKACSGSAGESFL